MKRILLDENVPIRLARLLGTFDACHVTDQGWAGVSNGDLIRHAEKHGFEVLVTADQNLAYQQNLEGRRLTLLILPTNNWSAIGANVDFIRQALDEIDAATYRALAFKRARVR